MSTPDRKQRIAVLGGGPSSIAAAFYLSDPGIADKYDITIYQYGWRLGGKGSNARNPEFGQRIEEHGLHQFLGFYDNAFRMLRSMWPEWKIASKTRFPTWESAFTTQKQITFMQECTDDAGAKHWEPWNMTPFAWPGQPGDPGPPTFDDFLPRLLGWLRDRHVEAGVHVTAPQAHIALFVAHQLSKIGHPTKRGPLLLGLVAKLVRWAFDEVCPHTLRADIDRLGILIRLGYAGAKGFMEDVLPYGVPGFDRINNTEFRQWLMKHGAAQDDVWTAPVKSLYDAAFAYNTGDATKPQQNAQLAAGVATHAALLMLCGVRGSFLWKMNAGMGDTVFSPMYDVLTARGVKFEFFSRVENLGLSADSKSIDRIEILKQVDLARQYEPFVWVKDLPCWPHEPKWEFIENGAAIKQELDAQRITLESWWCTKSWAKQPKLTLERGRDFDQVVLGISPAALKPITQELANANPAWRDMLENVPTIRTQAMQLWLTKTLAELGWSYGATVAVSYTEPFDSWGEMSHLLPAEDWAAGSGAPSSVEYFCGAMPDEPPDAPRSDTAFPHQMTELVKANAKKWLHENIGPLWKDAVLKGTNSLNFDELLDGFDAQYFRVNIDPSERYVLSVPGSMQYRLETDKSGFDNLFLAGDWIVTRINSGAFEAAIESGCRCSRAICGLPTTIYGVDGY